MRISEIFTSLEGEGIGQGEVATFIRTAGCNLECAWCDTPYARAGGRLAQVEEIIAATVSSKCRRVRITGGEPLEQARLQLLVTALKARGFFVSVETNGTRDISSIADVDSFCVDYKLESALAREPFDAANWPALRPADELKFVISGRSDYEEALRIISGQEIKATIIMSPCFRGAEDLTGARQLAEWIIADTAPVKYSLQLHKVLGVR